MENARLAPFDPGNAPGLQRPKVLSIIRVEGANRTFCNSFNGPILKRACSFIWLSERSYYKVTALINISRYMQNPTVKRKPVSATNYSSSLMTYLPKYIRFLITTIIYDRL